MYILNFCVNTFKKVGHNATSILWRPSSTSADADTTDESTPLIDEAQGDAPGVSDVSAELGLTASYTNWLDSDGAYTQILLAVFVFFAAAVIGFSFVFEDWPVTDSFYFAVVIFTTVGYGDMSPTNDISRVFTIFIAFFGIVILGVFLGMLGEDILDGQKERAEARLKNVRTKVMEQFSERDTAAPPPERTFLQDALNIALNQLPAILVLFALGAPIIYLEGWDVITGVYWMFITGTTVGFGDLDPTTTWTKMIAVVYIPLSVAVFGEFLGRVAGAYIERRNDAAEDSFLERAMTLGDLNRMDTDKDGVVSPEEFLVYMLVALQKVDQEDVDDIMDLFRKLDKSKTGTINKADLAAQYRLSVKPGVTLDAQHHVNRID